MNLLFIMNGGASKRYHTQLTIKEQDIAAHSFGVAWLCEVLTEGKASKHLIMAALAHDLAEHQTGDMPAPAKRSMGISSQFEAQEARLLMSAGVGHYYDNLYDAEKRVLKLADAIDGMAFCLRERELGNRRLSIVYQNFYGYAYELHPLSDHETFVIETINTEWSLYDESE